MKYDYTLKSYEIEHVVAFEIKDIFKKHFMGKAKWNAIKKTWTTQRDKEMDLLAAEFNKMVLENRLEANKKVKKTATPKKSNAQKFSKQWNHKDERCNCGNGCDPDYCDYAL